MYTVTLDIIPRLREGFDKEVSERNSVIDCKISRGRKTMN